MMTVESRRVRLSEQVANRIMAMMREDGSQIGDLLPTETELMERMKVGRSSVREALRGLAVLGMVEIRQGQGTFVRSLVPLHGPDVTRGEAFATALARGLTDDLLEVRAIIEVRAASLAARRATTADLDALERSMELARSLRDAGQPSFLPGAEFHLIVARAAHNDVLAGFVASYIPILGHRGTALARLPGYLDWELREHQAIKEAIADRDARRASTLMRDHLADMAVHYDHLTIAELPMHARSAEGESLYRATGDY